MEFWQNKIQTNIARDAVVKSKLEELGWNVLVVWECEIKTISARERALSALYSNIMHACVHNSSEICPLMTRTRESWLSLSVLFSMKHLL